MSTNTPMHRTATKKEEQRTPKENSHRKREPDVDNLLEAIKDSTANIGTLLLDSVQGLITEKVRQVPRKVAFRSKLADARQRLIDTRQQCSIKLSKDLNIGPQAPAKEGDDDLLNSCASIGQLLDAKFCNKLPSKLTHDSFRHEESHDIYIQQALGIDTPALVDKNVVSQLHKALLENAGWSIPPIDMDEVIIESQIGKGASGTIFRGTYKGSVIAVKESSFDTALDYNENEIQKEAMILNKLSHPNLLRCLGCAIPDRHHASIILEYVPMTLSDVISRDEELPLSLRLYIAWRVACGTNYLHNCNIIHRDLKSDNILLTDTKVPKIADFGTACLNTKGITDAVGTMQYTAPEIFKREEYNEKVDVYSFGIILWEVFTSTLPYTDINPLMISHHVVQGGRPPLGEETPQRLKAIIKICWDDTPKFRPPFSQLVTILSDLYITSKSSKVEQNEKPFNSEETTNNPKDSKDPSHIADGNKKDGTTLIKSSSRATRKEQKTKIKKKITAKKKSTNSMPTENSEQ